MTRAVLLPLIALLLLLQPASAQAKRRRKSAATFSPDYATARSYKYANLSTAACLKELKTRGITFSRQGKKRGVKTPVRIPDGVGGVSYRTALPRSRGNKSPYEVFDCRLVLALDDFSAILAKHDIDEVIIYSAWRPPHKRWPKGKQAKRHPGALAVDIDRLRKRIRPAAPAKPEAAKPKADEPEGAKPKADEPEAAKADEPKADEPKADEPEGAKPKADEPEAAKPKADEPKGSTKSKAAKGGKSKADKGGKQADKPHYKWLDVEKHFNGKIDAVTCGPKARGPKPITPEAAELHAIVCETAAARIFSSMLTPNYNKAHFNHFHFEVTPKVKWRIIR